MGYSSVCHALALAEGLRWAATAPHYAALHCTALCCTTLYCTILYCTTLYCTILYCAVLHGTALHCTVPRCTALYSIPCPAFANQPKHWSPSRSSTPPIVTSDLSTSLAHSLRFFYFFKYASTVDNEKDVAVYPLCRAAAFNL